VTTVFDKNLVPGWIYYLAGYGIPCAIGRSSKSAHLDIHYMFHWLFMELNICRTVLV